MKPLIGINVDIEQTPAQEASVQRNYFQAIQEAGGIPILIPPMPDADLTQVLSHLNGIMLIGGRDYDPKHYDEPACSQVNPLAPLRDDFDMRLVQKIMVASNMPVLGICGGAQALNIGLGGSLIQDIPSDLPNSKIQHSSKDGFEVGWNHHIVNLEPQSKLAKIYGTLKVNVPTSHHQAVARVGTGLTVAAKAEDGIIEAVEYQDKPFVIGVQWHPERDFAGNRKLFAEFVAAAARVPVTSK